MQVNLLRGISKATGIDLGLLVIVNIAYEIEGVCTSIVAQDESGNLYHARNLDFGLFFGWDKGNHTWKLAELLRPLLFNAIFVKGGKEQYRSVAFGGTVPSFIFLHVRVRWPLDGHEDGRLLHQC